jgi:transposase-like protein
MELALYKREHIAAWRESGLSQRAYCREHGLNAKTFGNWLRIDRQTSAEVPSLIPVKLKPAASSEQLLYLRGSGAYTLRLPVDISPQWLGALLKCLG